MVNIIFLVIFILGLSFGVISGNEENVVKAMLEGPKRAFYLFLEIYALLVFWGGILEIAKDSGLLKKISKVLARMIHPLFKKLDKDDIALSYISLNFIANMVSMGSVATPFGLLAMKRLQELNEYKDVASNEMITFVLINTSGLCIIPTTLIALRLQFNSLNPTIVIPYILIISSLCTIFSIIVDIEVRRYAKL